MARGNINPDTLHTSVNVCKVSPVACDRQVFSFPSSRFFGIFPMTPHIDRSARRLGALLLTSLALFVLVGCGSKQQEQHQMPPPDVVVETVAHRDVPLTLDYPARVSGSRVVEVRARINGVLVERAYQEGQPVKQGDLLFRIEDNSYKALFDQAAAQVAIQRATIQQAQADFNRVKALVEEGAVSRREFDQAEAALAQAKAGLAGAEANRTSANINLQRTEVRAPVAGIASKEAVTIGNLVNGGAGAGGDLLTTIVQAEPAYVDFSMTEPEYLRLRQLAQDDATKLEVVVRSGSSCAGTGQVDFTDSIVNPRTGTVRARAKFANPDGCLVSGQFLAVEVTGLVLPHVITVPKSGVLFGQAGPMLWVLGEDDTVQPRPVIIQESWRDRWILESGLQPGEVIVTQGIMKVGPGAKVNAMTAEEDAARRAEQQAAHAAAQNRG